MARSYFHGNYFINNITGVQKKELYNLGVYIVLSIIHGGNGIPMLARPVHDYIVSGWYGKIDISDIPDGTLKFVIQKLVDAESDEDLRMVFQMDEALELLTCTGYRKAVSQLTLVDCDDVTTSLLDYHLMGKVKSEMDQFISGLGTLGLLESLRKNPKVFEPFFLHKDAKLTPEDLKAMVTIKYSTKGCIYRAAEEQTYIYFVDFLDECAEGITGCSVEEVLEFMSASDREPVIGFDKKPQLTFLHHQGAKLPTASTCDIILRLPATHKSYEDFKESMVLGLKGHDGFGGV